MKGEIDGRNGTMRLRLGRRAADEFGDFDSEVILDHDDFAVGDELVVNEEPDGVARVLGELHDRARCQLENFAHGQEHRSELDGDLHLYVEYDIKRLFVRQVWHEWNPRREFCG